MHEYVPWIYLHAFIRENFNELLAEYNKQKATAKNSSNFFALPSSTFANRLLNLE